MSSRKPFTVPLSNAIPSTKREPVRRVALAFATRHAHLHTVVRGIIDYAQQHGPWHFTTSGEAHDLFMPNLKRWRGDGILTALNNDTEARAARRMKLPVVAFTGIVKNPRIPRVMIDQAMIGNLAAEHLISRGFRKFAFYGVDSTGYSIDREKAFTAFLAKHGFSATHFLSPNVLDRKNPWDDEIDALCKWVGKLDLPIGIFAVNDPRARMLADVCRMVGLRVPQDVGIIGVDNSQIDCEYGSPTLTTIACDWHRIGFEAARLLDTLMTRPAVSQKDHLIPPTGVIIRESTDITIVEHPAVARAVAFARANPGSSFGVKALVQAAGVSRRYLETSFNAVLGKTPSHYLAETRVERARALLSQTNLTLSRVAKECGFSDLRQFRRVFLRMEKRTPGQFRKTEGLRGEARRNQPAANVD